VAPWNNRRFISDFEQRAAFRCFSLGILSPLRLMALEILTGRSCALIFSIDLKAPRLRRLPVLAFFLREYKRYFQFTAANITTDG
jgi:hypothetical protein